MKIVGKLDLMVDGQHVQGDFEADVAAGPLAALVAGLRWRRRDHLTPGKEPATLRRAGGVATDPTGNDL